MRGGASPLCSLGISFYFHFSSNRTDLFDLLFFSPFFGSSSVPTFPPTATVVICIVEGGAGAGGGLVITGAVLKYC